MNLAERIIIALERQREAHPDRWFPLSALPGPSYLAERELEMAERRGEVERREFDGVSAWRAGA